MNILVTGGCGFIGRWIVKQLAEDHHKIWILDNLSNGRIENIKELQDNYQNITFIGGDIKNHILLQNLFTIDFDICYHLAASINVQDSINNPKTTFDNDIVGTFNVLNQCKIKRTKFVYMSTCMVYSMALSVNGIKESHPTCPSSPYAGAKLAGEQIALSYYHAYGLPVTVLRPFNTYGPYQKKNSEGGVIPIFIKRKLENKPLLIYGNGTQTRDFLYVTDCCDFVVKAGYSNKTNGKIINAGSGTDISIKNLAKMIVDTKDQIKYIPHIHPQSEIQKLLSNSDFAKKVLNWEPHISLKEGIQLTQNWIKENMI